MTPGSDFPTTLIPFPGGRTAEPTIANGNQTSGQPTLMGNQTSAQPTVTPGACIPFESDDFEAGVFPIPPWTTGGDGVWALDETDAFEGTYSIKSPNLDGSPTPVTSNATLTLCQDFTGGVLKVQVKASVLPPSDIFIIYINGESAAQLVDVQEWTEVTLGIPPGPQIIDFSYRYNFFGADPLPPSPPTRLGAVWLDSVVIETMG